MELCKYPENIRVRTFHIEAIQIPIVYNKYGDHDPDGLVFVPIEEAEKAMTGDWEPKPLILRANVGYNNREQTVGIGESKKYLWKADKEYGTCILQSFGDMRNHRYHGLFGSIIIEPAGAKWYRNFSKKSGDFEEQTVVTAPGMESFREYVLFIQNGIRLLDKNGDIIQTTFEEGEEPDAEDTGEKGYNYRSERFANR